MTFKKYPISTQIVIAFIFALLNILVSCLNSQLLHLPLFLDMIFIFGASFFGVPCGLITGVLYYSGIFLIFHNNPFNLLYVICCFTGTFFTWLLVTRHEDCSWIRVALLIFISTVVISFEGSIIYAIFLSKAENYSEETIILFITYNLLVKNIGLQLSAFLARIPINLIDKTIAVFGGLGVYKVFELIGQKVFMGKKNGDAETSSA